MGEDNGEIVLEEMRADNVVFQVFPVFQRESRFTLRVHDVDGGDGCKTVVFGGL